VALAGTGLFVLAAFGTVGVVGANLLLRPLGRRLDRQPAAGAEIATDYHFEAVCNEAAEAHIRALVVQAVTRPGFRLRGVHSHDAERPGRVTVSAQLTTDQRDDSLLEEAVSKLSLEPAVTAVTWTVLPGPDEEHDRDRGGDGDSDRSRSGGGGRGRAHPHGLRALLPR
jgi:putative Mg2+ transporter-C (MgtC) family protein